MMKTTSLESVPLQIDRRTARSFWLAAQGLRPPRERTGKSGVLDYLRDVRAVQFDPINIVGRNPDLVFQSRVADYRPGMLDELLYQDRLIWDGWDKMASLIPTEDWPYFHRRRTRMENRGGERSKIVRELEPDILQALTRDGPHSSLDFDFDRKTDWGWGPTRAARAALEGLYRMGKLGVHHRVGSRRYFDLVERLLPGEILETPEPHPEDRDYQRWHLLRRVSSLKLAHPHAGVHWSGIEGVKTARRRRLLQEMADEGLLLPVEIEGVDKGVFYLHRQDQKLLDAVREQHVPVQQAAVIAPLDNLLWDRQAAAWVFGFEYVWEVYKPREDREYGYYVLPVLYDDRFVGRFEPGYDRGSRTLEIKNWWWEDGVSPDGGMEEALRSCLADFLDFLGAEALTLPSRLSSRKDLAWLRPILN
jgi:hypothetical protein